jgi:hypothetical protein
VGRALPGGRVVDVQRVDADQRRAGRDQPGDGVRREEGVALEVARGAERTAQLMWNSGRSALTDGPTRTRPTAAIAPGRSPQ